MNPKLQSLGSRNRHGLLSYISLMQDKILQTVVGTAFADRTVLTIAVSKGILELVSHSPLYKINSNENNVHVGQNPTVSKQ